MNKRLEEIFSRYDLDRNQFLDQKEVGKLLADANKVIGKGEPTKEDIANFIKAADLNGDGAISKEELKRVFYELNHLSKMRL
mgnify:FL=1